MNKLTNLLAINKANEIVQHPHVKAAQRERLTQDQEEIRVCAYCHGEVFERWVGDEGFTFCDDCQSVEGSTIYISLAEWLEEHG